MNSNVCPQDSSCFNTFGSYFCQCNSGFYQNGLNFLIIFKNLYALTFKFFILKGISSNQSPICLDINECLIGNNTCDPNQNCQNLIGSYSCVCKTGFQLDPFNNKCVDINECLANPCGQNQNCINTDGSFTCVCRIYYVLSNGNCVFQERTTRLIQFQLSFINFNCSGNNSLFFTNLTDLVILKLIYDFLKLI